ncbi:hypothetical protein KFL_007690020 [Klebsormidium nitens]|uniref:Uncharacterized protein n=1 Tax=Klebsormidium nitens TaxID=105231 RepID=A0A1Y1IKF6_KLENI|nr:hypothetical protein KFL_007690020 [Klebsormidium nitens]|eukprot:GAQ91340.1 hypothetical protein KFL_007690020 [Klebsormidium nitens]
MASQVAHIQYAPPSPFTQEADAGFRKVPLAAPPFPLRPRHRLPRVRGPRAKLTAEEEEERKSLRKQLPSLRRAGAAGALLGVGAGVTATVFGKQAVNMTIMYLMFVLASSSTDILMMVGKEKRLLELENKKRK